MIGIIKNIAQFLNNMVGVFLGNYLGGALLVAGLYTLAYKKKD